MKFSLYSLWIFAGFAPTWSHRRKIKFNVASRTPKLCIRLWFYASRIIFTLAGITSLMVFVTEKRWPFWLEITRYSFILFAAICIRPEEKLHFTCFNFHLGCHASSGERRARQTGHIDVFKKTVRRSKENKHRFAQQMAGILSA